MVQRKVNNLFSTSKDKLAIVCFSLTLIEAKSGSNRLVRYLQMIALCEML